MLLQPDILWVVTVKYPKCATTTRHTLGSYCKVPKVCYYNPTHFGYFTITTQSVLVCSSTLWELLTTTHSVLGSRSTLWVVVMSGQCVIGSLTHFGWFCEVPKMWWNTCHTLGTYRHTLSSSAVQLSKVSWFRAYRNGEYYLPNLSNRTRPFRKL